MCKKIVSIIMVIVCLVSLSGCGCIHSWVKATCTEPRTCKTCGETDGEPRGHNWVEDEATSTSVCTACGLVMTKPNIDNDGFEETEIFKVLVTYIQTELDTYKPEIEYSADTALLRVYLQAPAGSAAALMNAPEEFADTWNEVADNLCELSMYVTEALAKEDYFIGCAVAMVSDANPDNALMIVVGGQVMYNILDNAE